MIYPDDRSVEIALDSALGDMSARWAFWQLRPDPDYIVAICAERTAWLPPRLVVRRAVPMVGEQTWAVAFRRTSRSVARTGDVLIDAVEPSTETETERAQ